MLVVAVTGALTALMAGTIAVVQTDIKRVLAYSTVSQLGFMFLAAGMGAFGVAVPEQYGGAGLDYVALALVLEEISAGDSGTSTIIAVSATALAKSSTANRKLSSRSPTSSSTFRRMSSRF